MARLRGHSESSRNGPDVESFAQLGRHGRSEHLTLDHSEPNIPPFVGRLGGNASAVLARCPSNEEFLKTVPDAAPLMTVAEAFDLKPFLTVGLWKSALMEGVGTLMLVWVTIYCSISPATIPEEPSPRWGVFNNAAFIGPLVGGILNFLFLTIFTFCFGAVSGAHLNPTITIATFFARLCSLPRAVLYISFQTAGAVLGGLLVRSSYGTQDFKVGGCWLYAEFIPIGEASTTEFMACTILLFFAFGVGLDPRQREVIGPTLGPFLVGLVLASLSFGTGFSRYGYGGASMNPARCLGSYVGNGHIARFHWIHWTADITAGAVHAVFYYVVPPWKAKSA